MRRKSTAKKKTSAKERVRKKSKAPPQKRKKPIKPKKMLKAAEEPSILPLKKEFPVAITSVQTPPISPYVVKFEKQEETETELDFEKFYVPELEYAPKTETLRATPRLISKENAENEAIPDIKRTGLLRQSPPAYSPGSVEGSFLAMIKRLPRISLPKLALPRLSLPRITVPQIKFQPIMLPAFRAIAGFVITSLIFTAPAAVLGAYGSAKDAAKNIFSRAESGLLPLSEALDDPTKRYAALLEARLAFSSARELLADTVGIYDALLPLIPKAGKTYESGKLLLASALHTAEALRIINAALADFSVNKTSLTERIADFSGRLFAALPLIEAAHLELSDISPSSLSPKIRSMLPHLSGTVSSIRQSFYETAAILPPLMTFLGNESPARHLVVFQNTNELRPTGGFIGSFALVDLLRGEVKNLEIPGGGPYDLACCLTERVLSPAPLHLIEPRWQFHDANWFADFPTSAEKLAWFYEKSGGPTVDGVIAINSSIMPKLLSVVGPIELPKYGRTFTSENFIEEAQKIVEFEYDKEKNQPKEVIADLAPILLERLTSGGYDAGRLTSILAEAIKTKEIQLYSRDNKIEDAFSMLGADGRQKETKSDSLAAVFANIAGGKTDGAVKTSLRYRVRIRNDGSAAADLEITRSHSGRKGELWSGIRNVAYVRIYAPPGAELISASGFSKPPPELFESPDPLLRPDPHLAQIETNIGKDAASGTDILFAHGQKAFGNWMQVDPGETVMAKISYVIPQVLRPDPETPRFAGWLGFGDRGTYSLVIGKQSGLNLDFRAEIILPDESSVIWQNRGERKSMNGAPVVYEEGELNSDTAISILFQKPR